MRLLRLALGALVVLAACNDAQLNHGPTILPSDAGDDGGDARAGTAPRPNGVVRVGTYNTHLFFDTVCDSGKCGPTDFEQQRTDAEFAAEVDRVARGVEKLDADVIALEEVESQKCIDALAARLASDGYAYPLARLGETGLPGSVDVGVLARGSLTALKTHRQDKITRPDGTTTTFTRELLELHLAFAERSIVFFAAHFRSKNDDDPGRRLAEATATHDIMVAAAAAEPESIVVLGGDLNDTPGSDTLLALEKGSQLVRLAADLPVAQQGTFLYQGQNQAIDHLYAVVPQSKHYVPKSALVVRDGATGGLGGSDHAGLRADLSLP